MSEWSIRRINRLFDFTESRNYLEIGVEAGLTFDGIEAERKLAVDPEFEFDLRERLSPQNTYYQMSSDAFFGRYHEDLLFDVIFLDGLHNFSQTYRDVINALEYISPTGFILIDDVFPSDVYSYNPIMEEAFRERADSVAPQELTDLSWHGDIFKVIAIIHDYHKNLQYRTFWNGGNAQTLVWWDYDQDRANRFAGLAEISQLSYTDVLMNMEILQIASEEEIWNLLKDLRNED